MPWAPELNQPQPSTTPYAQRPLTDRPFPYWGRINTPRHRSQRDLQLHADRAHHRMRSGLSLNSAWTWAKDLSDANGPTSSGLSGETGGGRVTNSLCRRCDRGNVGAVRRHRSITTAVYELPFGKGRHFGSAWNPVADAIGGGWRLSSILLLQTGPYLTATMTGGDPSGTNAPSRGTQRPDAVADGNISNPTADLFFNRNAFRLPRQGSGHRRPVQLQRRAHRPLRQRRRRHPRRTRYRERFHGRRQELPRCGTGHFEV